MDAWPRLGLARMGFAVFFSEASPWWTGGVMPTQAPSARLSLLPFLGKGVRFHRSSVSCYGPPGFNGFYNNVLDLGLTIFFTLEGILKAGAGDVDWQGPPCAC